MALLAFTDNGWTPAGLPWGVGWLYHGLTAVGWDVSGWPWGALWLIQVYVGCALVFHFLERFGPRVMPTDPPGPLHRGWRADVIAALIDGPVLGQLTDIAVVSLVLLVPAIHGGIGLASWPWPAQFALYLVVVDFGRYWLHRWYHESDFLWRFHRVHHTARPMSVLTTFRLHVFEALPRNLLLALPFKLLGMSGSVILIYAGLDIVKGFWHHANLRTYIGKGNLVFNSAELHWWHHAEEAKGQNANYGSTLSIWDQLFGTFYWPEGTWPERIGVHGIDEFPDSYVGRFLTMMRSDEDLQGAVSLGASNVIPAHGLGAEVQKR